MKQLLSLLLVFAGLSTAAQNADPYLSISTNPSIIPQGQNTTLEAIAGNAGNNTIVANSLRMVISVGGNGEILSFSDPMLRWTLQSLSAGSGNTLVLTNGGGPQFNSFDINQVSIIIKGTFLGGPSTISGNVSYITANNPLLPGNGLNASQGNANNTNDNSTTSLTVTAPLLIARLIEFTGTSNLCTAQLAWSTSSEENFSRFEIEQSNNGRDFNVVGTVAGTGGPNTGANYRFAYDQTFSKGYYRLKMIDRDGTINYSKSVAVATRCNERTVTINPNPVFENQSVTVTLAGYSSKARGDLYATSGQLLATYNLLNGVNTVKLSNLIAKGTYQLRVTDETGEGQTYKIVIMK